MVADGVAIKKILNPSWPICAMRSALRNWTRRSWMRGYWSRRRWAWARRMSDLLTKTDQEITCAQENALEAMTLRRLQREPVSRILGFRSFWKADFKISPATLDPRADSETLIEAVLANVDKEQPLAILDLGTGTGCLLLSLLQELPQATGTGIDISAEAIEIALQNAESLDLAQPCKSYENGMERNKRC